MKNILTLAANTLKENTRNKVYLLIVAFALLMLLVSLLLADLSVGAQIKIIKDMGLGIISITAVMTSVLLGMNLLHNEIGKKTIYNVLSKPVSRYEFILGKYLGLSASVCLAVIFMAAGLCLLLVIYQQAIELSLIIALGMICLEVMVLAAVVMMFSTFTTAILSGIFTLGVYILGHSTADFMGLSLKAGTVSKNIFNFLYYALPNLSNFDFKNEAVRGIMVSPEIIVSVSAYAVAYSGILLCLAVIIYSKKDF